MTIDWNGRYRDLTPRIRNFVDGRWSESGGELLHKFSPRDGRLLYSYGGGTARDVDTAVKAARRAANDGRWSGLPAQRRKEVLLRLAHLMDQCGEELALYECIDVGKPIYDALTSDVPNAVANLRYNAEVLDKIHGRVYAADRSSLSYELLRPVGVVAGIVGWNFPLGLAIGKIAPALAAGNCLILKPSELSALSAVRVAELALEAGVPDGVFNVMHGGAEIGSALSHHRDIDLLTFTGSSDTGKKLLVAAGLSNMKRLILECGGKSPAIVFEDSPDLDAVATAIVARAFWNQGQVCVATSLLLVQETIKDDLLRRVIEKTEDIVPGDPLDPNTRFGALVSLNQRDKVLGYVAKGMQEGARIAHRSDGAIPFEEGSYVPATILDNVSIAHTVAQEEIFGPVLSVISFRDEDEAIRIANGTIYGLSATVWTEDSGRAHRVTQRINAGLVTVYSTGHPAGGPGEGVLPVGGHKQSGIGVEGGVEGVEAYLSKTAVQVFA